MSNPFLNRLMKDDKADILHSSAYARAQSSGGMGADSVESFAERRKIDRNRTVIRGYNDSKIAGESGVRDINAKIRNNRDDKVEKSSSSSFYSIGVEKEERDGVGGGLEKLNNNRQRYGGDNQRYGSDKQRYEIDRMRNVSNVNRRSFVEPTSNRASIKPPTRRNPGISR